MPLEDWMKNERLLLAHYCFWCTYIGCLSLALWSISMVKVYIVVRYTDIDGYRIEGVFDNREKAEVEKRLQQAALNERDKKEIEIEEYDIL